MITNSTVTVPTIPEISPTTTPPATPPTPTAVHEVDEHSTTTGRVNSNPSVKNYRKLLILGYAQDALYIEEGGFQIRFVRILCNFTSVLHVSNLNLNETDITCVGVYFDQMSSLRLTNTTKICIAGTYFGYI